MGAFVDHKFSKGFLLDEERLRKLNNILVTRCQQLPDKCNPEYQVYRADTFTYTTDTIEQVLNEGNAEWQRMLRLIVSIDAGDILSLKLDFGEAETSLRIEGEDRDQVFLLFSELRQFLSNEVNILRSQPKEAVQTVVFGLMLTLVVVFAASLVFKYAAQTTMVSSETALASQDLAVKLDYLIEIDIARSEPPAVLWVLVAIMSIMTVALPLRGTLAKLIGRFYPRSVFLLGKEIERHEKRQSLRHNILWGIVISSVIGILTGLIVWAITR
jgi:hypothetical protein